MEFRVRLKKSSPRAGLEPGPLEQQASALPTELTGLFHHARAHLSDHLYTYRYLTLDNLDIGGVVDAGTE